MKKNKNLNLVIIFSLCLMLVCITILFCTFMVTNSLDFKNSKKVISIYEWENSTSKYYHGFDYEPTLNCNISDIYKCEQVCLKLFDYYTESKDTIGVGKWYKRDCFKLCSTELLK